MWALLQGNAMVNIAMFEIATFYAALALCILVFCTDFASLDRDRAPKMYAQVM